MQSIVNQDDEDNAQTSSLGSSDLQNEENNEGRPESPTINGEDEPGEEDSEARPLIQHRPRSTSRGGTSSEQQGETAENFSTPLSRSEVQKMQNLVKKLRLQVGSVFALRLEGRTSSIQ